MSDTILIVSFVMLGLVLAVIGRGIDGLHMKLNRQSEQLDKLLASGRIDPQHVHRSCDHWREVEH